MMGNNRIQRHFDFKSLAGKVFQKKNLYIALSVFIGLLALLVLVVAVGGNTLRKPVEIIASGVTGRTVKINGGMDIGFHGSATPLITVRHLTIAQPDWVVNDPQNETGLMADIGRVDLSVKILPLLIGNVILPAFSMDQASFALVREESGKANWVFGDGAGDDSESLKLPVIHQMSIRNGQVTFIDKQRKLNFRGAFESSEISDAAEPFHLEGEGALNKKKFSLKIVGGSLFQIQPDKPYDFTADATIGDTRITGRGSIQKPFDFGIFETDLSLSGGDLADLYYLIGLAFPNTPPYKLSGKFGREGTIYYFKKFSGTVGDSDLQGDLSVDIKGERPKLVTTLTSRSLDFDDLGTLFGAAPATGGGETASPEQKAQARKMENNDLFFPDARLQLERVRSMDAELHYRAQSVKAQDLPLKDVSLDMKLENAVMSFDPFTFGFPQGRLSGNARVNAQKDVPDVDMDVRLTNARLEEFFPSKNSQPAPLYGPMVMRARLHGQGDSVHKAVSTANGDVTIVVPHGEIRQAFAELMGINIVEGLGLLLTGNQQKTDIRCGVANFKARKGILHAETIVFDTGVVIARGEGRINLRTENLNLRLQGEPKEARLIRVMAPVTVTGSLRHPVFGVDAGKAAGQVGIAAALGVLLSPLASILPFVDEGLAEDENCAALLAEVRQKGVRVNPQP